MVYAVAQIAIHDRDRYERYVKLFPAVLARFGGRVLAADECPTIAEGEWKFDKFVLLAFDDASALTAWMTSPEYREIARDRIAATSGPVLIVRGLRRR